MTEEVPSARAVRVGAKWRPDIAPRRIPIGMRWATRLHRLPVQIAWLVALGGVIGALFVVPRIQLHPAVNKTPALARIVSRGDDTVVYDLDVDGKRYRNGGIYYGTAGVGDPLPVWYDPRDPARATTLRDQPDYDYGTGSLLVLAFPAGAILVAGLFMWHGRRFRLLRYGRVAESTLRASEPTRGGRLAYLRFAYDIEGTKHTADITTVRRYTGQDPKDEQAFNPIVLYDPADPDHACVVSDLTCRPIVFRDNDREWFSPTTIPYLAFALPLGTLVAIGILVAKTL